MISWQWQDFQRSICWGGNYERYWLLLYRVIQFLLRCSSSAQIQNWVASECNCLRVIIALLYECSKNIKYMITILPIDPIFAITTISSIDAIFTIYSIFAIFTIYSIFAILTDWA